jgi:hypothetical protein
MQTAPTDYFEVKPNQALKLSDFSEAVVPIYSRARRYKNT